MILSEYTIGFVAGCFCGPFVWEVVREAWDRFKKSPPDPGSDDDDTHA